MFLRMNTWMFETSLHSAVAVRVVTAQQLRIYNHPGKTHILTRQCNQCYSDFTIGISNVLLTTATGCLDCLAYII
jgi:hypothetical protein